MAKDGVSLFIEGLCDTVKAFASLSPTARLKIKLSEIFTGCGLVVSRGGSDPLKPILMKHRRTDYGMDLLFHLPPGLCPGDFRRKSEHVAFALNAEVEFEDVNGKLLLRVMDRRLPKVVPFAVLDPPAGMCLPVPVGHSRAGVEWLDLAAAPHALVAGTTGSGKSNLLHVVLAYLWGKAEVSIIDMKRLEYSYACAAKLAQDERSARQTLESLNREMERRLERLQAAGVVKIQDYAGTDMPYQVCIVDELAELRDEKALGYLDRLLRLARAVGISLVLATQRPSVKVLDGDSRAMLDARVCFKTVDELNSRMVLGETHSEAAYLTHKGRAVFRWHTYREVQTMFLPVAEAVKYVPETPKENPKPEPELPLIAP